MMICWFQVQHDMAWNYTGQQTGGAYRVPTPTWRSFLGFHRLWAVFDDIDFVKLAISHQPIGPTRPYAFWIAYPKPRQTCGDRGLLSGSSEPSLVALHLWSCEWICKGIALAGCRRAAGSARRVTQKSRTWRCSERVRSLPGPGESDAKTGPHRGGPVAAPGRAGRPCVQA